MEETQIDAAEFRARQRRDWGRSAAGWRAWQGLLFGATAPVSERLVELARIEPGDHVLDVAAGAGEPSVTAAQVVGPDGKVVATDIAPEMLAFGRERAAVAGIDNIEFVEADASSLDFLPETFDAAVSRWGLIFEPEAEAAAGRIRGFLEPGGWLAISSWGPADRVPMIAVPMRTVMTRLNVPPPPSGTPGPFSRPTREALAALLENSGFADVEAGEVEVAIDWASVDEFTRYSRDISAPIHALLEQHPPEVREETWAAVTEAVRPLAAADGRVRLTNLALVAAGRA
jgi:SAM-dependent methyltransferase